MIPETSTVSALPLLYSYRRCPFAMRARMALLQAGQAVALIDISLRDKPAEMLALSPKGTVPVLRLLTGDVLDQSMDIMGWAFAQNDAEGWWTRAQSASNVELMSRNDSVFKHHLDRYKYPNRFPDDPMDPQAHRTRAVDAFLLPLQQRLRDHPHLGGETPCAADLAIFPFVRQFAAVEPAWWSAHPMDALRAWLARWTASALFEACMVKVPAQEMVRFPAMASAA